MESILEIMKERAIEIKLPRTAIKSGEETGISDRPVTVIGPSDNGVFCCLEGNIADDQTDNIMVLLIRETDLSQTIKKIFFDRAGEPYSAGKENGRRLQIASMIWNQYPKREARKLLQEYFGVSARYVRCYLDVITKAVPQIYDLAAEGIMEIKEAAHIANLGEEQQREIAMELQQTNPM